jgi:hypothetical protein
MMVAGTCSVAFACDKDAKASSAGAVTTAAPAESHCAAHASGAAAGACLGTKSTAVTASSTGMCRHSGTAAAAGAGCADKGTKSALVATEGTCAGHGMTEAAAHSSHTDCDACADMSACARELEAAGATTQIVQLKNGVMFVYTADSPSRVRAVQAAMARRNEHMAQMTASGEKAHLCGACKEMRGAAASGKLSREVVNIEGGCLTLMTSNDPTVVSRIHAMAGLSNPQTAARVKD